MVASHSRSRAGAWSVGLIAALAFVAAQWRVAAEQAPGQTPAAPTGCRVTGRVVSMLPAPVSPFGGQNGQNRGGGPPPSGTPQGTAAAGTPAAPATSAPAATPNTPGTPNAPNLVETPLPGATIVVHQGTRLVVATSADADGKFSIRFTPGQTFHVSAEMFAFRTEEKDLTLAPLPCDTTLDFKLTILPRAELPPADAQESIAAAPAPSPGTPSAATPAAAAQARTTTAAAGAGRGGAGRGAGRGGGRGFTAVAVNQDATGAAAVEAAPVDQSAELASLLPAGFSLAGANADAVSVNGGGDAMNVDRSLLNDRMNAIGRGEFDPATGQFAQGFGPAAGGGAGGGGLDAAGQGFGGLGGGPGGGGGGRGGPGGGGFALGGRGGRGQSPYQGSITTTYGGSALDATNLQPNGQGGINPVSSLPFNRNNFGGTLGGPVIIPGIYKDTNRRTSFQVNYTGTHSTTLQDQYATVPTDAERAGDFSASPIQLINPKTGQPFPNNQIPVGQMDQASLALLNFIPQANVPGATQQNFHTAATTLSTSNAVSLRLNQNLTPTIPQRGQGAGRGGPGGGGRGGGGPGGRGGRGLTVNLSVQLQYRENAGQQFNVLPQLGGNTKGTSTTVPVSLTVSKGRTTNTFSVNVARTSNTTSNGFENINDVAGTAGINYPAAPDPLNWGVPNLTFSNFNVRSTAASVRSDSRITASYTLSHPMGKHQLRYGFDFRHDASSSQTNSNARGGFTFTGLYTGNGASVSRTTGADFADFLLGMPQQATLQVGGVTRLHERAFDTYLEDNWQKSSRMTFNLGVRWEVTMPYVEVNGHMANLDVAPGFTAASVVLPGQAGALSGVTFPAGLVRTEWHDVGPRVGMAYRVARGTVLNTSYSITYNTSSLATIARNLVAQPPFALTETNVGSLGSPLSLENGLLGGSATTTNNYGVDPNYGLGMIQTWNTTVSKTFSGIWVATVGYTGTKGTSLDLLRAPNRNPDGTLRIAGVDPFTWESSGGHSLLNLGSFGIQRGLAHGMRFGATYTLAKSMDNASSLGAGGAVVAQNDQDLGAEWALSNFDQRHNFSANMTWELPFGVGRKWFANGGFLAAIVGEWSMNLNFSAHSGSPFTPRVTNATTSVANGTSGSLRANYSGGPISVSDPSLLSFFNTGVFSVPTPGDFGTSPRNIIIGPGGHVVNASFSRDMRLGGTRAVTIQINANNLFNTIQWSTIDTNINSATFGQVTRFASMRTITANLRFRF